MRLLRNPVYLYRLSRWLYCRRVPVIPRLIDYFTRFFFSCWLPHTADIGARFEIGYGGLGCVIHDDAIIGNDVHFGTNVTIGGNARELGTPVIGSNVFVGGGVQILGPIKIGDGSIVGANAVVLIDVPERSVATGNPARIVHLDIDIDQYILR